jgi:integrase/recombinase XerD
MGGQVLVGEVVGSTLEMPAPELDLISRLTVGWLWSFSSPHTRRAYERNLREWLAFCDERNMDPLSATRAHGDLYARWLEHRDPRPAPKTVGLKLASVSSWYTYLVLEDVLPVNKFAGASRPKIDRTHSETVGLDRSEARAMVAAAEAGSGRAQLRTAALIRFMLSIGPRAAEVSSLTIGSLGFERGFRTVRIVGKGQKVRLRNMPPTIRRGGGPVSGGATGVGGRGGVRGVGSVVRDLGRPAGVSPLPVRSCAADSAGGGGGISGSCHPARVTAHVRHIGR